MRLSVRREITVDGDKTDNFDKVCLHIDEAGPILDGKTRAVHLQRRPEQLGVRLERKEAATPSGVVARDCVLDKKVPKRNLSRVLQHLA